MKPPRPLLPLVFGLTLGFAHFEIAAQEPSPTKPLPTLEERETTLRVQIFLDKALFGPGIVDGRPGEFTRKAITYFQQANGLEANGLPDRLPLSKDAPLYATYTIRAEDKRFVGDSPSKPADQAKKKYLPYGSLMEFVCERFHCSAELLALLNPELNLERLKVDDTLKVPAVEPFLIEEMRTVATLPEIPELKSRWIQIYRKERILLLKENERLLASVPITPGSDILPTPPGKWRVVGISTMPNFRWDEGVLNHGVRTSEFLMLPPGPRNPVGIAWCALSKPGIGIHGTNQPQTIGRAASHGCMRVANWDVSRLIQQISSGVSVLIE